MRKYLSKKLIQETKAIIRLDQFLRHEVGLKEPLLAKRLRGLLYAIRAENKR